MKTILPCDIVRDLLPSYVDGLTSEMTNESVADHLESCPDCEAVYQQMLQPDPVPEVEQKQVPDYLKKVRRRIRRWLAAAIALVIIVLGVLAIRFFVVGEVMYAADPRVTVSQGESGQVVQVFARNPYGQYRRCRIQFELRDIPDVGNVIYCTPYFTISPFPSDSYVSAVDVLNPNVDLRAIVMVRSTGSYGEWYDRGDVVWYQDNGIDTLASFLWKAYNPYVGDASADNNLVGLAMEYVGYNGSPHHMELQTSEEPYGMTIVYEAPPNLKPEKLQAMGCILLAQIGNLDHVTFQYPDDNGESYSYALTAAEASEYLGRDVKTIGQDLLAVQEMLDRLGY